MTRRIIVYVETTGNKYATPEFSRDKAEFELFGMGNTCDKKWDDIISYFENVNTLKAFQNANAKAQSSRYLLQHVWADICDNVSVFDCNRF